MELTTAAAAALDAIATAPRAWSTPAELAAAGADASPLVALGLAEPWRGMDCLVLTPWGLAVAGRVVRERWATGTIDPPGGKAKGKPARTAGAVPYYAEPATPDVPAEPPRWGSGATLPLPELVADPHPGPLEELIRAEELLLRTELAGATGVELEGPALLWGRPIPREKGRAKKAGRRSPPVNLTVVEPCV